MNEHLIIHSGWEEMGRERNNKAYNEWKGKFPKVTLFISPMLFNEILYDTLEYS